MAQPVYTGFVAITPSDTVAVSKTAAIYVGGAGNLTVQGENSVAVTFYNVPAGTVLPIVANLVKATGTTATNLVALR